MKNTNISTTVFDSRYMYDMIHDKISLILQYCIIPWRGGAIELLVMMHKPVILETMWG